MKKLLTILGLIKKVEEKEMTLDEYIISIRPKTQQLSQIKVEVYPTDYIQDDRDNNDNGPEESGCMVLA